MSAREIPVRRVDTDLSLPAYKTEKAAAFDLTARIDVTIEPGRYGHVPLNVAMRLPEGYAGLLFARSSLHKRGLLPANGVGLFDEDFAGDNDEWIAILYNFSEAPVTVERGDRVMQVFPLPMERFALLPVESLGSADRGGLGSTGIK